MFSATNPKWRYAWVPGQKIRIFCGISDFETDQHNRQIYNCDNRQVSALKVFITDWREHIN